MRFSTPIATLVFAASAVAAAVRPRVIPNVSSDINHLSDTYATFNTALTNFHGSLNEATNVENAFSSVITALNQLNNELYNLSPLASQDSNLVTTLLSQQNDVITDITSKLVAKADSFLDTDDSAHVLAADLNTWGTVVGNIYLSVELIVVPGDFATVQGVAYDVGAKIRDAENVLSTS